MEYMDRFGWNRTRIAPMTVELAGVAAAISAMILCAVVVPGTQVFGPAVVRGKTGNGRVALTFDDGPSESTPAVLDALARHRARATFFFCGANALRLPEVARRVAAEGHEIGNHTQNHPRLFLRLPGQIAGEIGAAQEAISRVTGQTPQWFRPPYGVRWFGLSPALRLHGLHAVLWSACIFDWRRPREAIEAGLRAEVSDGAIVLLHDGDRTRPGDRRAATAGAMERVLPELAGQGLRFVTLSELLS